MNHIPEDDNKEKKNASEEQNTSPSPQGKYKPII